MDECRNCGASQGLHHYQIGQCPVGGVEAPVEQVQRWATTTYQEVQDTFTRAEVQAMIDKAIEKHVEQYSHVDPMEAIDYQ